MKTIEGHGWVVQFTLPPVAGVPERRWTKNAKVTVIGKTLIEAATAVLEAHPDATLVSANHVSGGERVLIVGEVIRPAKPRRTLNRKQAREWLSGQEHWEVLETPQQFMVGCSTSPITCRQYAVGPTFTAAVIALRKKMGVE